MQGYNCAGEGGTCICYGKVNFGFETAHYYDMDPFAGDEPATYGNWSEMRDVRGAIGCEKKNFVGGDSTGTDKYSQGCMCYPSSKFCLFSSVNDHIRL